MLNRALPALAACLLICFTDAARAAGGLFVSNWGSDTVSRVDEAGRVSTLASGIQQPIGLALDPAGNVYVGSGRDALVRRVGPDGAVSPFAEVPAYAAGLAFDAAGNLYASIGVPDGSISRIAPGGGDTTFAGGLFQPRGLAFDGAGMLYVATYDAAAGAGGISRVAPDGTVSRFAPGLEFPTGLAFGPGGALYATEAPGTITRFDAAGVGTVVATVPPVLFQQAVNLEALAFGEGGEMFVADSIGGVIRRVSPTGVVTTFASGLSQPSSIATVAVPEPAAAALSLTVAGLALLRRTRGTRR